jgi:hypothetical protein
VIQPLSSGPEMQYFADWHFRMPASEVPRSDPLRGPADERVSIFF